MADVALLYDVRFDMQDFDPTGTGTVITSSTTVYSYVAVNSTVVTVRGTGLTYGANGTPNGGTIVGVDIVPPNSGTLAPIVIDATVPAATLDPAFFTDATAFWTTLIGGNDTLDFSGASAVDFFGSGSAFGADGNRFEATFAAGGNDALTVGDAAGLFLGDVISIGSTSAGQTTYEGGDDTILGGQGGEFQDLFGDVRFVRWVDVLVGGDDSIVSVSEGSVFGDVYRQLNGGALTGGDDTITVTGGSVRRIYGDAFEIDDFAGAMAFDGGNDVIDAGAATGNVTAFGDFSSAILNRVAIGEIGPQVSMGNDAIIGSSAADTLVGDAGFLASGSLLVALGSDVIRGGAGDDTIVGDVDQLGTGTNEFLLTGGADILLGEAGNDTIFGQYGDDIINGGSGIDRMVGGAGNDNYVVDVSSDVIEELAGGGTDLVRTAASYTLSDNVENALMLGTASIFLAGNADANTLIGNAGDNVLNGRGGADRMFGGAGNDTYYVDDADDIVGELAGNGIDLVRAFGSYTMAANIENVILEGSASANVTGNDAANTLVGNGGANTLNGRGGADRMFGGAGNDTYVVDVAADLVGEAAGAGIDTVLSAVSRNLDANVERMTLLGTAALNAGGNQLDNLIIGNAAANSISAATGNDTIKGGLGADTLTGGAGADVFVYAGLAESGTIAASRDVITDFARGSDTLFLVGIDANVTLAGDQAFVLDTGGAFVAGEIRQTRIGADVLVEMNTDADAAPEMSILLRNTTTLSEADFAL